MMCVRKLYLSMKNVYSPPFKGQAKDWSENRIVYRKGRLVKTVDEYGDSVVKKLISIKRK